MGHNLNSRRVIAASSLVALLTAGSAATALGPLDPDPASLEVPTEEAFTLTGGALAAQEDGRETPGNPFGTLPPDAFSSYSTGTVFYTDQLLSGDERRTDVEMAHSGAAFSSVAVPERRNEIARLVAPALAPGEGFGRGSALDLAFNQEGFEDLFPDFDDEAEAKAPPTDAPVVREEQKIDANPFVDAQALRAEAAARSVSSGCVLGSDVAFGLGSATNVKLLKQGSKGDPLLAARAPQPPRGVSQSTSRTRLVPAGEPGSGVFGLMAEARETVAPITVLEGDQQLTIEVAGEWVLRAVADGTGGKLTFGPDMEPKDDRPLLRILDSKKQPIDEVTLEDYLGDDGLDLELEGLIRITLGEDPRAVTGDAETEPVATSTLVAGATDVLRVTALDQVEEDFDELRVGHMEVAVAVPEGGLTCPGIGVKKALDRREVTPGETFTTTITVSNPNDCILDDVKLTDAITAGPGVAWTAKNTQGGVVTVDEIGPLGPGESEDVRVDVTVDPTSLPGVFSDVATAEGTCGRDPEIGETTGGVASAVPVRGTAELEGPRVTVTPAKDAGLPVESAPPPSNSSPGGATPVRPAGNQREVTGAPAPAKPADVSSRNATRRPAGTSGGGAPALARSGGLVGAGLAGLLIAGGLGLRAGTARRRR